MAEPRRIVWAPSAQQDLADIWTYFARVGSDEVADRIIRDIDRSALRLERHSFMGRPRDELAAGLRSVLVHPHIVFYRVRDDAIDVVRVLHQRRDVAAIFAKERGS